MDYFQESISFQAPQEALFFSSHPVEEFSENTVLLLHGYQQNARRLLRSLGPLFENASVAAVNAPFPAPYKNKKGDWREGYSWYFYDATTDWYMTSKSWAVTWLSELLNQQQWRPQTLIGYSQGGYLLPYCVQALPFLKKAIGINCRFNEEDFESFQSSAHLYQIHGTKDSVVDFERAEQSFQALQSKGAQGEFFPVEGANHQMDQALLNEVKRHLSFGT